MLWVFLYQEIDFKLLCPIGFNGINWSQRKVNATSLNVYLFAVIQVSFVKIYYNMIFTN